MPEQEGTNYEVEEISNIYHDLKKRMAEVSTDLLFETAVKLYFDRDLHIKPLSVEDIVRAVAKAI
jgi:hypothetical protein